jgi:two-component system CheB/CheR fusion protein
VPNSSGRQNDGALVDLLENAPVGVHLLAADGRILWANRAELEMLGYAHDEWVGRPIADFHVDGDPTAELFGRLRAGAPVCEVEARLRGRDGAIKHVAIRANATIESGRLVAARCVVRDVGEALAAERRLTTKDAVTRALAESESLVEATPRVLEVIGEHLGWAFGALWVVDAAAGTLRCAQIWKRSDVGAEPFEAMTRTIAFAPGVGLPGRVWSSREAAWIPDVTRDANFPRAAVAEAASLRGAFGLPIALRGEVLGVMEFFSHVAREPDPELLHMMTAIGSQLAQYIDRKRAEGTTRLSEQRFARFMQHVPGLAWIKDLAGRYVYANDAAVKVFGIPREQLYGHSDAEVFAPETAEQFARNDRAAVESGSGVQVVEQLEHADGVVHHSVVSKFPILDAAGEPALVGGMAFDVTDRLQAQEALRRSEERLALAQRAARIGTFEWEFATGRVTWTEAQEALYGLPPGGFDGTLQHWRRLIHPDDLARADRDGLLAVAERHELDTEYRVVRPDGSLRWIATKAQVFSDDTGAPQRLLGINLDVTERKQAELALQEADRRKDEFLAVLAHELRNPLAPIRSGLEALRTAPDDAAISERVRTMLERQVEHMVRLVDDLLEQARISRGTIELRRERVELRAVVQAAIETSLPAIDARGHELVVSLPDAPLVLDVDPVRIAQALANLLHNAAKYTDAGGRIELTAERCGDAVSIRVRDTGMGLPVERLPGVFDLFAQGDDALARTQGGLGIGLSLVKRLVELHGGSVAARSEGRGRGSEFEIRLALAQGKPATPRATLATAAARDSLAQQRILIVDDNEDAAEALRILLRRMGGDVRVAHDGPSALVALREHAPAAILLDIGMAGMDGYEVARRIRAGAPANGPVLIAVTGWGQESDRQQAREAGFDHHLVKPVKLEQLRGILERIGR